MFDHTNNLTLKLSWRTFSMGVQRRNMPPCFRVFPTRAKSKPTFWMRCNWSFSSPTWFNAGSRGLVQADTAVLPATPITLMSSKKSTTLPNRTKTHSWAEAWGMKRASTLRNARTKSKWPSEIGLLNELTRTEGSFRSLKKTSPRLSQKGAP